MGAERFVRSVIGTDQDGILIYQQRHRFVFDRVLHDDIECIARVTVDRRQRKQSEHAVAGWQRCQFAADRTQAVRHASGRELESESAGRVVRASLAYFDRRDVGCAT